MNKNRFFALVCAAAVMSSLSACGNSSSAPAVSAPAASSSAAASAAGSTARTTFTVGFDAEYPPYGFKADDGSYVGFDLDLAQEVCNRNGWELVRQPIDWNSKDMELDAGNIDCIWNGFTMTGREDDYTWVGPYVNNSIMFVVTADSGTNSDKVSLFIGTDNYKAGEEAARAAVAGFSEGEKIKIGLVNLAVGTDNGTQREKGFRDYIDKVPSAAVTAGISADSNLESATAAAKKLMIENPDINVIVGFNEWMALGVGYAVRQLGAADRVRTVGFDSNVVSISMLETGEMQALIVQNPFAMGYLSVKYAARLTRGEAPEAAEIYTDVATVTKENMFDGDIQKLLFSFK